MNLLALPAFDDNYIWMLHDGQAGVVVDPGDAAPVIAALERLSLRLAGILVTHHHGDHVGGLAALLQRWPVPVWGPAGEPMPVPVTAVRDGDTVRVLGLALQVIDVPGHTAGHVAYFIDAADQPSIGEPVLFCGDTLFSAGCGRLFEGTPAQMLTSLSRLAALPGDTRVCCAHEYTLSNLRFARAVEPDNAAIARHEAHCLGLRATRTPTLPSRIALERQINPFLRSHEAAVIETARERGADAHDPVAVFAAIRAWKNTYR
ncbi:hydroxyacylglutathione hydrolase [Leptothrix cholodnii]|nr:hydroxyacylglutathione hydrolase [Leptothrix cholodnii]